MGSISPFTKEQLMPQTEMLEIKKQKGDLFIGLPKETHFEEKRISLSPDAVAALARSACEPSLGCCTSPSFAESAPVECTGFSLR